MIERKFKVGDEAKFCGDVVVIVSVDDTDIPYLISEPGHGKIGWVRERELSPLLPAIPPGWTPADEPPDSTLRVRVLTPIGERNGWFNDLLGAGKWEIFTGNLSTRKAYPGEVLAWREIEPAANPAAQVRYAVRYSDTVKDKDDDGDYYQTPAEAIVEAKRLVSKYGKEIEVGHWVVDAIVKPAEPEVVKFEE